MRGLLSLPRLWHAARAVWVGNQVRQGRAQPARLAQVLEHQGPAYIKLGQMLATRPDIVGEAVATALEHLQDRLPPFADTKARALVEQSLGKKLGEIFSVFGPPVAAASIAQVHKATTTEGA